MCNCINETIKQASDLLVKRVEEKSKVHKWIDKGSYQNAGYSFNAGGSKIGMPFIIQYKKEKKNGEPEKNITTENVTMYPTFCPFCGEKYPEKDKPNTTNLSQQGAEC